MVLLSAVIFPIAAPCISCGPIGADLPSGPLAFGVAVCLGLVCAYGFALVHTLHDD